MASDNLITYNAERHKKNKETYEGMVVQQNGCVGKCIKYISARSIIVLLDDVEETKTTVNYFKRGILKRSEDKRRYGKAWIEDMVGREYVNKAGRKYKVIGGKESRKLDVEFEDGTIVNNVWATKVMSGDIVYPGERMFVRMKTLAERRIGERCYCTIGMGGNIESYRIDGSYTYYNIRFDDGNLIEVNDRGNSIRRREITHPTIKARYRAVNVPFKCFEVYEKEFSDKDNKYYSCKCARCGKEDILTFDEMVKHESECKGGKNNE